MSSDTASNTPPILLLAQAGQDDLVGLGVPDPSENLFTRIIRNPTRLDRPMRETRCTEMLCAVLMSCPRLRTLIIRWMARPDGQREAAIGDIDDLRWHLDTERNIGGKRDDLRIEGWRITANGKKCLDVLWTVEVKVQAYFHESTDATGQDDDEEASNPANIDPCPQENSDEGNASHKKTMVNQLVNYDDWLAKRKAPYKAGFVLAIPNHQADLPVGLKCRWTCLTWTGLGELVKDALDEDAIPAFEKNLAQHMLGFIHQHLWRRTEMTEGELTFDHLAFLRAHWVLGLESGRLVDNMVAPLLDVLDKAGLGLDKSYHQKSLLKALQRSVAYSTFTSAKNVTLFAGFVEGAVRVWCETSPRFEHKDKLRAKYKSLLPELNRNGRQWLTGDAHDQWDDLHTQMPLVELLAKSHQAETTRQFVGDALNDLKAVEIDRVICETCDGSKT